MAIYSLNHKHIGKATQREPHTASAHVRYITRSSACREVLAERMPDESKEAQAWLREQEDADRKNARVIDKVMLALPRELTAEQRAELVREFAETVTQGRASWLAAIHDKDKDAENPHCHLVIRDRDFETGKRVAEMSERGSTDRLREAWEVAANAHLEQAGYEERIDRHTLAEQGVDREPTIHEGVRERRMRQRGARPNSKVVEFRNGAGAKSDSRDVDYPAIDQGRTRAEHNAEITNLAEMRAERQQAHVDAEEAHKALQRFRAENQRRQKLRSLMLNLEKRRKQSSTPKSSFERPKDEDENEPDW